MVNFLMSISNQSCFLKSDGLCLWELSHHKSRSLTSPVLGVVPPVGQVNLRRASNHQLQLPGIEHGDQP